MFYAIDVSKHQGTMNWDQVKNAGVTHAMIRAGYGRYASQKDPQFDRNVAQCVALGIDWGVYWYSYATSPEQAKAEARCCLQVIKGLKPTMPVAYDIEYEPGVLALSNAQRTAMVKAFLDEIESAGYYGVLYASTDFIRNKLNWKELSGYDIWCAQYGDTCTCPLPYGMWQYSSTNALNIPGFGKNLDCNRVYKDYPSIIKSNGLNGYTKTESNQETNAADKRPAPSLQMMCVVDADANVLARAKEAGLPIEQRTGYLIGPASNGDAMSIWQLSKSEGCRYFASSLDSGLQQICVVGATNAVIARAREASLPVRVCNCAVIGPASMGDAMAVWGKAQAAQNLYFASFTES